MQNRTAYRPKPYTLQDARRWLGYLVTRMDERNDHSLDWRNVHRWASPRLRLTMTVIVGLLVAVYAAATAFSPLDASAFGEKGALFEVW